MVQRGLGNPGIGSEEDRAIHDFGGGAPAAERFLRVVDYAMLYGTP
jgi:hypothetical protein